MNEGCATFVHYTIMNPLYDRGLITEGSLAGIHAQPHLRGVFQPEFNDRRYSGFNPYALGYGMMADIRRICEKPTAEDRDWFPAFAGKGDWMGTLKDAWANYRDESFIEQFLSPKLMRDFRLFALYDKAADPALTVSAIHDERGYKRVRRECWRGNTTSAAPIPTSRWWTRRQRGPPKNPWCILSPPGGPPQEATKTNNPPPKKGATRSSSRNSPTNPKIRSRVSFRTSDRRAAQKTRDGNFGFTTLRALSAPVTGRPAGLSNPICTSTPA